MMNLVHKINKLAIKNKENLKNKDQSKIYST